MNGKVLLVIFTFNFKSYKMNDILRGCLAGYGAKKLGGGCVSTIIIFILLWIILGYCH
jgi:hypothetical protein